MKKKTPIVLMTLLTLAFFNGRAQSSCILYNHFDPPLTVLGNSNLDTLKMDFNQDGVADFGLCWFTTPALWSSYFISLSTNCDFTVHLTNDTTPLSSNSIWQHDNLYISFSDQYEWGVRLKFGNDYYYGWAYSNAFSEPNPGHAHNKIYLALHDMAYCTIPNYPLRWGQTTFTGVEENNEAKAFATVHPNPTTGLVQVFGQGLKQAEVTNALGQRVATAKGEGDQMTIDIAHLPTGLYFVCITDEQGRKCVRKVVKE